MAGWCYNCREMTDQPSLDRARPVYGIGAAARLVGIPAATIRTWEDRYGGVTPTRTDGGRRMYSHEQLDTLQFLADRMREGMQPAEAHRLLEARGAHSLPPAGTVPAATSATVSAVSRQGHLILLVERDVYAADLARHFLELSGYRVEVTFTAQDARHALRRLAPSLVLIDLMLDGGTGGEIMQELASSSPCPVVAMSALDVCDRALATGADRFLPKPLDPPALLTVVEALIGLPGEARR